MERAILLIKKYWFENTEAVFTTSLMSDKKWDEMRRDAKNVHWFAPTGSSEYILNKKDYIFRKSTDWGKVGTNCNWTLHLNLETEKHQIGFCHLSKFKKI